jgi:hypothetical protein
VSTLNQTWWGWVVVLYSRNGGEFIAYYKDIGMARLPDGSPVFRTRAEARIVLRELRQSRFTGRVVCVHLSVQEVTI